MVGFLTPRLQEVSEGLEALKRGGLLAWLEVDYPNTYTHIFYNTKIYTYDILCIIWFNMIINIWYTYMIWIYNMIYICINVKLWYRMHNNMYILYKVYVSQTHTYIYLYLYSYVYIHKPFNVPISSGMELRAMYAKSIYWISTFANIQNNVKVSIDGSVSKSIFLRILDIYIYIQYTHTIYIWI